MMKILITLFLLLFFSTRTCLAQSIQDNEVTDNENSLLWKISGNDLQHDSYLLGTMHNVERTFLDRELKDYVFMPNDTSKIIRKSILWKLLKVLDKNGLNMTH